MRKILILLVVSVALFALDRPLGKTSIETPNISIDARGNIFVDKKDSNTKILKPGEFLETNKTNSTKVEFISNFKGYYKKKTKKNPEVIRAGGCVIGITQNDDFQIYALFTTRSVQMNDAITITCKPMVHKLNISKKDLIKTKNLLEIYIK